MDDHDDDEWPQQAPERVQLPVLSPPLAPATAFVDGMPVHIHTYIYIYIIYLWI
jgi:hypothetical protein